MEWKKSINSSHHSHLFALSNSGHLRQQIQPRILGCLILLYANRFGGFTNSVRMDLQIWNLNLVLILPTDTQMNLFRDFLLGKTFLSDAKQELVKHLLHYWPVLTFLHRVGDRIDPTVRCLFFPQFTCKTGLRLDMHNYWIEKGSTELERMVQLAIPQ